MTYLSAFSTSGGEFHAFHLSSWRQLLWMVPYFKDFAVIERESNTETPFEISGKVFVSTDFSKVREIQVGMKDLTVGENLQFMNGHPSK